MAVNVLLYLIELARPSLAQDWAMLGYAQLDRAARATRASRPVSGTG